MGHLSPPPSTTSARCRKSRAGRFLGAQAAGEAWPKPAKYTDIHMPRNTGTGVVIGAFSLVFGFAMIWHIWWLAIVGFVGMIATFIYRTFDQDVDYYVPAAEVERIENEHRKHLEAQGLVKSELKA
jgi:cytochrome o ubiquinol oxidase subunit 1